jgi:RHS repeat-associated protein
VKTRRDYLPFGEELQGLSGRTSALKYGAADGLRQQFTSKERDSESGLDYFLARYYSSAQGRFTSVDPLSGKEYAPQSWNRYVYTINNPLNYFDPDGLDWRYNAEKNSAQWFANDAPKQEGWVAVTDRPDLFSVHSNGVISYSTGGAYNIFLNPKGPQGWQYSTHYSAPHFGDLAWLGSWSITSNGAWEANGWAKVPVPGVGIIENVPEHMIAATGLAVAVVEVAVANRTIMLYRGVPKEHEFFDDALNGTARPFGGHTDPLLHNRMNTHSVFTSWTERRSVAEDFAGEGGVVLERRFSRSQLVRSPDIYQEKEHLVRGTATGAKVTKP